MRHQLELLELIKQLARNHNLTVIMAMHDLNMACRYSDFMVMLKDGRIFAVGEPEQVLTPDNIRAVYGVDVSILKNPYVIVPLRVVK